jgi:hypothetical protein
MVTSLGTCSTLWNGWSVSNHEMPRTAHLNVSILPYQSQHSAPDRSHQKNHSRSMSSPKPSPRGKQNLKDPTTLTDDDIAGLKSNLAAWKLKKDLQSVMAELSIKAMIHQLRLVTEQVKAFHRYLLTEDLDGKCPSFFLQRNSLKSNQPRATRAIQQLLTMAEMRRHLQVGIKTTSTLSHLPFNSWPLVRIPTTIHKSRSWTIKIQRNKRIT